MKKQHDTMAELGALAVFAQKLEIDLRHIKLMDAVTLLATIKDEMNKFSNIKY